MILKPVYGNTYPVRDKIKALGGRWDANSKVWMVPEEKLGEAQALVAGQPPRREPGRPSGWRPCGYPGCHWTQCDDCDGEGGGQWYRSGGRYTVDSDYEPDYN